MGRWCSCILLCVVSASCGYALEGRILDADASEPIAGAQVILWEKRCDDFLGAVYECEQVDVSEDTSGSDGAYAVSGPPGAKYGFSLGVTAEGYQSVSLPVPDPLPTPQFNVGLHRAVP